MHLLSDIFLVGRGIEPHELKRSSTGTRGFRANAKSFGDAKSPRESRNATPPFAGACSQEPRHRPKRTCHVIGHATAKGKQSVGGKWSMCLLQREASEAQERLAFGFAAAQRQAAHGLRDDVQFAAHQAVAPTLAHEQTHAQKVDAPEAIGAAQEDDVLSRRPARPPHRCDPPAHARDGCDAHE